MRNIGWSFLAVLVAGCALQRPTLPTPPDRPPAVIPDGYGRASIRIRWPEGRSVQTIPYDALLAHVSAFDASGSVLATASLQRQGTAYGEASIDLPVGSGRYLEVRLDSAAAEGISMGRSNAFSVRRNQTTQIPVVLEPIIRTRFGPLNALTIGGGAVPARLFSVAVSPDDTVYMADFSNHAVRAVSSDGAARVVIGQVTDTATQSQGVPSTVSPDNSGEGGPADAATLRTPHGVYVAPNGDCFVADTLTPSPLQVRIRYVPAATGERFGAHRQAGHIYTLFTMSSAFGASGMVQDSDGALLFTQQLRNEIWRLTEAGTASVMVGGGSSTDDGSLPSAVSLSGPWGLALDARGNLLFSEWQGGRVRMLCRSGGSYYGAGATEPGKVYTVLDGLQVKTQFGLTNLPQCRQIALDRRSNLLVIDSRNYSAFGVDRQTGGVSRLAGGALTTVTTPLGDGGTAASASLNQPHGIAIDSRDRLFIGDTLNGRVRWLHL